MDLLSKNLEKLQKNWIELILKGFWSISSSILNIKNSYCIYSWFDLLIQKERIEFVGRWNRSNDGRKSIECQVFLLHSSLNNSIE